MALDPAIAKRVAARKPAPLLLHAGLSSGSQPIPDGPSITGATQSHGAVTGRLAEHKLDAKHWKAFTRPPLGPISGFSFSKRESPGIFLRLFSVYWCKSITYRGAKPDLTGPKNQF